MARRPQDRSPPPAALVVADASPLIWLARIDQLGALAAVFDQVVAPGSVIEEVTRRPKAPGALLLAEAVESERIRRVVVTDERRVAELCLLRLHAGEAEAIALAEELGGVTLLIDERLGRQVAADAGLPVLGTLGALAAAADRGWPVPPAVIEHLHSLGFYATPGLWRAVRTRLAAAARRRRTCHGS